MQNLSRQLRRWGRISFFVMWLPFATLLVAMIGLPSGDYSWTELPILARASLLLGGVFALISTVLLVGAPLAAAATNRSILSSGRPAPATILAITDTGTTINQNPVVRFLLEVQPNDRSAFQAETERLVSRLQLPRFQPGASIEVKYQPESLAVAIVDDGKIS